MKTIGLIGGMSWESSVEYYRLINRFVRARLGGNSSAKSLMVSVDFEEIAALQHAGQWSALAGRMAACANQLERGGADCLVLCTNTMHKVAPEIERASKLPLLHIVDATAAECSAHGTATIGLLGTRFTMEDGFYQASMARHGVAVETPDREDREFVHDTIYGELCRGVVNENARERVAHVMQRLTAKGASGIVLGCTELGLLVGPGDAEVPVFDSTAIHARAAVDYALAS